jgi:thioredoxin reductase (NADPH)
MAIEKTIERVKCLIIGSGPAGYTAAIYAARANLAPVLYTGLQAGGQLTTTTDVENFPGYPEGVTGPNMMEDFRKQAERFGTDIRFGIVTGVDFSGYPLVATIDGERTIEAGAVIVATGATARYLGLPSEERFRGAGVSACATCDGFFYRGKDVAVVGGGDTACEEAVYLAGLCRTVYLIVRKPFLRASKVMQERVLATANITVLFEHNTVELFGSDMGLEGARLVSRKGEADEEMKEIRVDGFFLAIGHVPNTDVFKEYLHLDAEGYIVTEGTSTRTNVKGVFAAGDVMDPVYRQGITSAATGCKAALDAERFLAGLCQ